MNTSARSAPLPKYLQIADDLRRGIAQARYPVGTQLPTELELSEELGISRHTAREAIRVLSAEGLVTRRQRAGTTVVAVPGESRYTHEVRALDDLQQYARSTLLRYAYIGTVALNREQARRFGARAGDEWIYATGLRHDGSLSKPICVTRLFLNPVLEGIEQRLRQVRAAVYSIIEKDFGITIARVDQEFQGMVLDAHDAHNLEADTGSAALLARRLYYDSGGRLLEVADNVHPADRFVYRMSLRR